MDELEFHKRVYEKPRKLDQEVLDAANTNPDYQRILDEASELEDALTSLLNSTELPDDLSPRLLALTSADELEESERVEADDLPSNVNVSHIKPKSKKQNLFQYYAIAASLILAIGITLSLNPNNGPSPADIAFGNDLLSHLYGEIEKINDIKNGQAYVDVALNMDDINGSMANTGARLLSTNDPQPFDVRWANPCKIIPVFQSAHLLIEGNQGAVSIIVVNNSPVENEFVIRDDRFNGVVIPMAKGNLILVGEQTEDLNQYKSIFSENIEWLI